MRTAPLSKDVWRVLNLPISISDPRGGGQCVFKTRFVGEFAFGHKNKSKCEVCFLTPLGVMYCETNSLLMDVTCVPTMDGGRRWVDS